MDMRLLFLDDNDTIKEIGGFPLLGSVSDAAKFASECEFFIAIGIAVSVK